MPVNSPRSGWNHLQMSVSEDCLVGSRVPSAGWKCSKMSKCEDCLVELSVPNSGWNDRYRPQYRSHQSCLLNLSGAVVRTIELVGWKLHDLFVTSLTVLIFSLYRFNSHLIQENVFQWPLFKHIIFGFVDRMPFQHQTPLPLTCCQRKKVAK